MSGDHNGICPPLPTTKQSNSIQAIDKDAVHRICSGQVVLNLATAVKELVENSLDAGATSIEVRLKECGSELVEVIDNGSGVEEANLEGLTLKHHTSKLREFSDLMEVVTFGFRGEALSSLCALSEMTIITRHLSSKMGTKLTFDARGLVASKAPCARQEGTTVSLLNLFSSLPVRQKEFIRNLKREFHKMTQLLYAYCLISKDVRILCSNQSKKGGKTIIASTQGSSTYRGNITCIFGAKQAASLLDLKQQEPDSQHLEEVGLSCTSGMSGSFELEGCISSCAHGQGRSAPDRQYYFINNRPCELSKVAKSVNEVYHHFNLHQYPFVFLNIKTDRSGVDVNVTPDKRQIFIEYEKLLIATLKATVLHLYENIPSTFQMQNVSVVPAKATNNSFERPGEDSSPLSSQGKFSTLLKNFRHSPTANDQEKIEISKREPKLIQSGRGMKRVLDVCMYDKDGKKQLSLSSFVLSKPKTTSTKELKDDLEVESAIDVKCSLMYENDDPNLNGSLGSELKEEQPDVQCASKSCGEIDNTGEISISDSLKDTARNSSKSESIGSEESDTRTDFKGANAIVEIDTKKECKFDYFKESSSSKRESDLDLTEGSIKRKKKESHISCFDINQTSHDQIKVIKCTSIEPANEDVVSLDCKLVDTDERGASFSKKVVYVNTTLDSVLLKFHKYQQMKSQEGQFYSTGKGGPRIRFYSDIDPTKNKNAEAELQKEISKDMFAKMEIIGQFNLGFIITKLGPDLFIIDQHATDEKYNFETLQMHTTLQNQKLIVPQVLELTAANESILMENIEIFTKNGFSFIIDDQAEPTKRVRLAAKPISHNWEFGKEDIDELLFMLQDSPHTMCRPSRVRAMFASRACRKSVMIGTPLSKAIMQQLVLHMGEIEQPWNCPHGRPTMRHLVNLELTKKKK